MRWRKWLRPQDVAWLALFSALALVSPTGNDAEIELLTLLAALQIVEPRLAYFATRGGVVLLVLLKLLLGFLLLGVTGGITSSYYLILILPVITGATGFGLLGTVVVSVAAAGTYWSFVWFVDPARYVIPPDQLRELWLRVLLLGLIGFVTHQLVEASRQQAKELKTVAEQLAEANRNLRAAEAAVRRSERLAALGQMMAGLAHELRNPLGTMKASAELLAKNVPEGNAVAAELSGYIAKEVDRTNSLISRFLEFARPVPLKTGPADVNALVDRAVAMLENKQPPADVAVNKNYSPDIPPVELDAELIERVVYNLLLNAAEASPPGGTVTVKTRRIGGTVEIAVIDRGTGIDPKHRESIFNPFFTTKPGGVGMGLAVVARIVDEHGGKMAVESEQDQGSVFRVLLPLARPT